MNIQVDQKVSVHLTITVHHQVHRDFLITLYFSPFECCKIGHPHPHPTITLSLFNNLYCTCLAVPYHLWVTAHSIVILPFPCMDSKCTSFSKNDASTILWNWILYSCSHCKNWLIINCQSTYRIHRLFK